MSKLSASAPRLLAGFGLAALLGGTGLASMRPAHSTGGPVPVAVTNAPLPTRPTDQAGPSQPVSAQEIFGVTNGFGTDTVYTVPAGKRLVIETVTATSEISSDSPNAYSVLVLVNDAATFAAVPVQPSGSLSTGTQAVHLYADPGTTVIARVFGKSTSNDSVGVGLSGYLVDAPQSAAKSAAVQKAVVGRGLASQE